jgi:hypothetical protein
MDKIAFAQADRQFKLTRHEAFDADFDWAYVHPGDLALKGAAGGLDILKAFGCVSAGGPDPAGLFVVDGDLVIDGTLDLDTGIRLAGPTHCPLFIHHDGDACLRTDGEVFDSHANGLLRASRSGLLEDDEEEDEAGEGEGFDASGWPEAPEATMTRKEARRKLIAQVFDGDKFLSEQAFKLAKGGTALVK